MRVHVVARVLGILFAVVLTAPASFPPAATAAPGLTPIRPVTRTVPAATGPEATLTEDGLATVVSVATPSTINVENASGVRFTVGHIGVFGGQNRDAAEFPQLTEIHRSLLPAGTVVRLQREPGLTESAGGVSFRHVFVEDDETPVAGRLLAAGGVWIVPTGPHAFAEDFADRQIDSVRAKSGVWQVDRTRGVFRPAGISRGGIATDDGLIEALQRIDAFEPGRKVLRGIGVYAPSIVVDKDLKGFSSSYSYQRHQISVDAGALKASTDSLSTLLIGMLSYAEQAVRVATTGQAIDCWDTLFNSYAAQAEHWSVIHGGSTVGGPINSYEWTYNHTSDRYKNGTLRDWLKLVPAYQEQCNR